jgi:hypothetical protein
MSNEFIPRDVGIQNCDGPVIGTPHPDFDYLHRTTTGDDEYPEESCERYLQVNGKFDNLQVTNNVTSSTFQGSINIQSWKGFDIQHPNKPNHRLRHICLEGPEAGVYHRGKGRGKIIELPNYWKGLVEEDTISVHLTPVGNPYVLFVEQIKDNKVYIETNWEKSGIDIEYYYIINASRIDGEPLIVEYEGTTPADYPGDFSQFSISGYDYGRVE